jgi:hypothetical protein
MATIEVSGHNAQSAPSPVQRMSWTQDWNPHLTALTAWAPHPANSQTTFRCTTTSTVAVTEGVVDDDLTTWVDADQGHRAYSVT